MLTLDRGERMAVVTRDPWLVPARQCELPGRDLVSAAVLHARRESVFLAFASLVLTATIALPLLRCFGPARPALCPAAPARSRPPS